jgi:starvation-inducible DNA-binding protein
MEQLNNIDFQGEHTKKTIEELNGLLSDLQVYYQNLRGFHWNIKGPQFFELHTKFEELYDAAAMKIDEVAERILTLGGTPLHAFEDYLSSASVEVRKDVSDAQPIMESIFSMHLTLLNKMRQVIGVAGDNDDEGTQDLIAPMISEIEKTNWMFGAYLKK